MRGKLAITAIVITLALFALIWVLYGIIKENNDQYSKIVFKPEAAGIFQPDPFVQTGGYCRPQWNAACYQ